MTTFLLVLLTILKVIGIILLVLLGLILLILALALFVPFRYVGDGFYKDGEYGFVAKVTYLLHIVTVIYDINAEENLVIKIFGIKYKKKEEASEEETGEEKPEETTEETQTLPATQENQSTTEGEGPSDNQPCEPEENKPEETPEETGKEEKTSEEGEKKKKKKKKTTTKSGKYDKIKGYIEKIKSEDFKVTVVAIKKELIVLLKAIMPRKWQAEGKVGFEDPTTNGQVCAAMGALFPILDKHSTVYCDFENPGIDIKGWFKGRVFGITILVIACRLFFNKSVRKTFDL